MANLGSDSLISRRIVRAFLDFLSSVELTPGVDGESLEVAKECLQEVFKLDSSPADYWTESPSLIDIFSSLETNNPTENKAGLSHGSFMTGIPRSPIAQTAADESLSKASISLDDRGEDWITKPHELGSSKDELFGKFFAALEKIHFFTSRPDGNDDPVRVEKATQLFHDALADMERYGCQAFNEKNLAETFKMQGNMAIQSKLYSDATELYSCAIALCEDNAVYYSNRAAAYTLIDKYDEAIKDCLRSIEIDPNYSKAYSRLGFAYYAQGNYTAAINKGFKKALELNPDNETFKENIQAAENKLKEQQQKAEGHQTKKSAGPNDKQSAGSNAGPPFASMPFNMSTLPNDFASMFGNMTANAFPGQHSQNSEGDQNAAFETKKSAGPNDKQSAGSNAGPPFASMPFNMSTLPNDFASMFGNVTANAFPGQHSQNSEGDQNAAFENKSPTGQNASDDHSQSSEGSRSQDTSTPFASMPFNVTSLPGDFANVFRNMAANAAFSGQHSQSRQGDQSNERVFEDAGVEGGENISFSFGEQMPENLSGTLRSMMEMFSGTAAPGNSQDTTNGRSASS